MMLRYSHRILRWHWNQHRWTRYQLNFYQIYCDKIVKFTLWAQLENGFEGRRVAETWKFTKHEIVHDHARWIIFGFMMKLWWFIKPQQSTFPSGWETGWKLNGNGSHGTARRRFQLHWMLFETLSEVFLCSFYPLRQQTFSSAHKWKSIVVFTSDPSVDSIGILLARKMLRLRKSQFQSRLPVADSAELGIKREKDWITKRRNFKLLNALRWRLIFQVLNWRFFCVHGLSRLSSGQLYEAIITFS